jgi:hypothetical protein
VAFGDDDLAVIFSSANAMAVAATFSVNSTPLAVYGLFTKSSEASNLLGDNVETYAAAIKCSATQTATVLRGMTVVIDGHTYTVTRKERGGMGADTFYLKT